MNTKLFFAPALLLVSSVGFAGGQAEAPGGQAKTVIAELDANQDGQISQSEASNSAAVMQSFAAIDRNSDSSINHGELSAYLAQQRKTDQSAPAADDIEEEEAE